MLLCCGFGRLLPCALATCCSASRRRGLSAATLEAATGSTPPQFFASSPSVRFSRLPMSFASAALTCGEMNHESCRAAVGRALLGRACAQSSKRLMPCGPTWQGAAWRAVLRSRKIAGTAAHTLPAAA
jgi:hypothetical protein